MAQEEAPAEVSNEQSKEVSKSEEKEPEVPAAKSREGDTEHDGLEEVALKRPINGKTVEFKIKDAIQAYVKQEEFNRNMDRRISHISQKEKKWASEMEAFKGRVGDVIQEARTGDPVKTLRALAKLATAGSGLDVVEFEKQYFEHWDKVKDVYTKMSPQEREAYWAKRALAEAKEKTRELENEKALTVETSKLSEQVVQAQKQYELSNDEFWGNYQYLAENNIGEGKKFASPNDIQVEDVVRYSLAVRHEEKVLQAGKKFGIDDDETLDRISEVTATDPTITVEEIQRVIETSGIAKHASQDVVENLNRKAERSNLRFNQASSTKKNGIPEGYDEETLAELYRNSPRVYQRVNR